MKVVGEKQIMAFMTDVDNIKMTKVSIISVFFLAAVDIIQH
jgi:hypothetical protein